MSFGKWLIQKRNAARLTQVQLAKRVGISANYISALERDEPNARDGSPRRPRIDKVERLAKALDVPLDEARLAAGYAPQTVATRPTTIPELVAALNALGIEMPQLYEGLPDPDGEGFEEILERIYLDVELVTNRIKRGAKIISVLPLELAPDEPDIELRPYNDKTKPLSRSG